MFCGISWLHFYLQKLYGNTYIKRTLAPYYQYYYCIIFLHKLHMQIKVLHE